MNKHFESCSAPICAETCDKEALWYPGEEICSKKPLSRFQKKQVNINNLLSIGKYKFNPETSLTYVKLTK